MKKAFFSTSKDKFLNFAVGAGIPAGTVTANASGGCTGVCGSCGGTCIGGFLLAAYLCGCVYYKRHNKALAPGGKTDSSRS